LLVEKKKKQHIYRTSCSHMTISYSASNLAINTDQNKKKSQRHL